MITVLSICALALAVALPALAEGAAGGDGVSAVKIYIDKRSDGSSVIPQEISSRDDVKNNANGTKLWVTADLSQSFATENLNRSVYLFELEPWQNDSAISLTGATPIDSVEIKKTEALQYSFQVGIDLSTPNTKRLYNKFLLGVKKGETFVPVGSARYIDNVNALSDIKETPPVASTKKGLLVRMVSDAQLLGIGHATVKLYINDFIAPERGPGTEEIRFGGESFYFNLDKITEYDKKIKALSDNGVIVTAQLLLRWDEGLDSIPMSAIPTTDTGASMIRDVSRMTPIQHMIHPGALKETNSRFYGLNVSDSYGVKYFCAFMSYLADRYVRGYTGESSSFGRITNVILGDEIGRAMLYNNCGPMPLADYARDYMRALRIADTAMRSRFGGARVYTSFDQYWNSYYPSGLPANYEYKNKELFDALSALSLNEGNFPWNISYQAHNEKLDNPAFWNETSSANSPTAQIIDFNNISALCEYVNVQNASFLSSEHRKILITDCGFSSGLNSKDEMDKQAAAYAYAFYKISFLSDIEAYIYHRHVDSANENQLSFGLWTNAPDSVSTANTTKTIYDVFKYIDTDLSLAVTEFAKPIIGISDWSEAITGFNETALVKRTVKNVIGDTAKPSGSSSILFGFNAADLNGFTFTGYSGTASLAQYTASNSRFENKKNLQATFTQKEAGDFNGIARSFKAAKLDLSEAGYLTVDLRADAPQGVKDITAKLYMTSGTDTYEGEAKFTAGKDYTLSFKLSDWDARKEVDQLKLIFKPSDNVIYEGDYNIIVNSIATVALSGSAGVAGSILKTVLIIVLVVALIFVALALRARYIRYLRHQERLARQRQAARRRRQLQTLPAHRQIYGDDPTYQPQQMKHPGTPGIHGMQGSSPNLPSGPRSPVMTHTPSQRKAPPVKRQLTVEDLSAVEKALYFIYKLVKKIRRLF